MKKLLIYCQDMGGTKAILPLLADLQNILPSVELDFVIHTLANKALHEAHLELKNAQFTQRQMSCEDWVNYLQAGKITHVMATLSSPYLDPSNALLFVASRKLRIPTIGFLDHWKGFDRFFDGEGKFSYFPEIIGCPDEITKRKLLEIGFSNEKCFLVGHPGLEKRMQTNVTPGNANIKSTAHVLVISQPINREGFVSIFRKPIDGETILEMIGRLSCKARFKTYFRPHPKEDFDEVLPAHVCIDETKSVDEALQKYDFFLGVDSMMLLEAYLSGKKCFVWQVKGMEKSFPYPYGKEINSVKDLEASLHSKEEWSEASQHVWQNVLSGSTNRATELLQNFIG